MDPVAISLPSPDKKRLKNNALSLYNSKVLVYTLGITNLEVFMIKKLLLLSVVLAVLAGCTTNAGDTDTS